MLYWAEGNKKTEDIKFSNSDPSMIKFMMKWFREICNVPEKKFRIALHIHELLSRKNVEKYWSDLTGIPLKQFQKTFIKPTSLGQEEMFYTMALAFYVSSIEIYSGECKGGRLDSLKESV